MTSRSFVRSALLLGALGAVNFVGASPADANECAPPLPALLHLPDGFQPEGITRGHGSILYVGGFADGGIYTVDARTGQGEFLVPPQTNGRQSVGIKLDDGRLFVAGGATGHAYVYDARTGAALADFALANDPTAANPTFINDVLVTDDAAYFTDSFRPVFYKVPLHHHQLPHQSAVQAITLSGDYQSVAGQFNGNGIETVPDSDEIMIVGSAVGVLYRVNPDTGVAKAIDLGGGSVVNGDGLVLDGHTLYVVENFSNQVAVVRLQKHAHRGEIVRVLTNPNLDIPATATLFEDALYVTNARFSTTNTPTTPYAVVRVPVR